MRKVLSSISEVCHFWANRVQSEGRAGNVFFEEDKIYSYGYHFCIARHLGNSTVAITTRGYSNTTSRHISHTRSAASHLKAVYCFDPAMSVLINKGKALTEIKTLLEESLKPRIRQTTKDSKKASALAKALEFNEYLAALPLDEQIVSPIDTGGLDDMRTGLAVIVAEKAAREAEQKARRIREQADNLTLWRSGNLPYYWDYNLPVALRINEDKQVIQTTKGAEIPVQDAIKLWPIIQRVKAGIKDYTPGEPLGNYRLTQIKASGDIIVGCHNIAYSELETIAQKLNLI